MSSAGPPGGPPGGCGSGVAPLTIAAAFVRSLYPELRGNLRE